MFKTIVATCLLTFSCSSGSLKRDTTTNIRRANLNTSMNLLGGYNFRSTFDYNNPLFSSPGSIDYVIDDSHSGLACYSTDSSTYNNTAWNLGEINISWLSDGPYIDINFLVFTGVGSTTISIRNNFAPSLSYIDSPYIDSIIAFNQPYFVTGDAAVLFNVLFTKEDNQFTTTYTGYYNFRNNISAINTPFHIYGGISFNTSLYRSITNTSNGALGGPSNLLFLAYNVENTTFTWYSYTLPYNIYNVITANAFMESCKMSITSYNTLSSVGTFAYIRSTEYDDADFGDMLFSVADTPVYFISRLLSFELFGVNLFVALTGLLTLAVIIVCIRKFW